MAIVENKDGNVILRRRLAFMSGALVALTGCSKMASTQLEPPDRWTLTALPARPSTAIPDTSCEPNRQALEKKRALFDEMYDEIDALYRELPQSCPVVDDRCIPQYKPFAKRVSALQFRLNGLSDCSPGPPIVSDYIGTHQNALRQRLARMRDRIAELADGVPTAGERWDQLVRHEAKFQPCLSCVKYEPTKTCD